MGKKILEAKALYVILSVLVSVSLWIYVTTMDGSEQTKTISGIQVQFIGEEQLEARDLMILGTAPKVAVRVQAMPRVLAALSNENITATVDVSRIKGASQLELAYTVTYPEEYASAIQELNTSPGSVTVNIVEYTEREIPIVGVFTGSPADGYVAGDSDDFVFYPETITVSGQVDLVNQIYAARVTVSGEKLTDSVEGEFPYELISNTGEVLKLDVECSDELVETMFPILVIRDVDLTVKYIDGGGATADDVVAAFDTEFITVSGSRMDMAALKEIVLGTVDLAEVRGGDVLTFPIPLANELNNVTGVEEVNVVLLFPGLTTKTVITRNIETINVPEGWTADIITGALSVEVRGKTASVAAITGDHVRVVVDMSTANLAEGQYTMTAKVYLDNVDTRSGIFGTDYRVVVALAEGESEPEV